MNGLQNGLLISNLAATWYLVGLIWLIQVVHYPLFSQVGNSQFVEYERQHANRITPVVGFPMLVELVTAILLCLLTPQPIPRSWMVLGFILVATVWLSTALIQVPCHVKLAQDFDPHTHRWLVVSNWIRTFAWTARGGLMSYVCWMLLSRNG